MIKRILKILPLATFAAITFMFCSATLLMNIAGYTDLITEDLKEPLFKPVRTLRDLPSPLLLLGVGYFLLYPMTHIFLTPFRLITIRQPSKQLQDLLLAICSAFTIYGSYLWLEEPKYVSIGYFDAYKTIPSIKALLLFWCGLIGFLILIYARNIKNRASDEARSF